MRSTTRSTQHTSTAATQSARNTSPRGRATGEAAIPRTIRRGSGRPRKRRAKLANGQQPEKEEEEEGAEGEAAQQGFDGQFDEEEAEEATASSKPPGAALTGRRSQGRSTTKRSQQSRVAAPRAKKAISPPRTMPPVPALSWAATAESTAVSTAPSTDSSPVPPPLPFFFFFFFFLCFLSSLSSSSWLSSPPSPAATPLSGVTAGFSQSLGACSAKGAGVGGSSRTTRQGVPNALPANEEPSPP
mmetsp:Transcript_51004/g.115946  ORF Transcript_51004/g.115946 Transcript_51004/m.115946 type:complete len:244 (+) Transcript_51004:705-1436(+)